MRRRLVADRDPLCRDLPASYFADFSPLGIRLHFETNSQSILKGFKAAFCGFGLPQQKQTRFTIRLFEDTSFHQAPPWPEPVFRGQRNLFYISIGAENTAVADLDHGLAIGFLSSPLVRDEKLLRGTFIEGLAFTMATHGKAATHSYVHASAVAKGGKGIILSGPSGAGKSTLAFAFARRGFHIVADDVVYLRRGRDGVTAWGIPWRLRLAPESIRMFPELDGIAATLDPKSCCEVMEIDLEEILPGCPQPSCKPAAVFFLDRSGGPIACQKLNPDQATRFLARDLISDAREVMKMHQHAWEKIAQRGSFMLRYGEDLDSVVDTIESMVRVAELTK